MTASNVNSLSLIVLITIVAGGVASWTSLRVRFALDGFYHIPTSLSEIKQWYSDYYFYVDFDEDLNCTLYSYYNDPRVMILLDFYGNIAGLRTCYIKRDVTKNADLKNLTFPYRFDDIPMFTSHNYWGVNAWCTSVLFLSPDTLKAGGRQVTSGVVDWSEVWVKPTGTYINISKDESQVTAQLFTKQNCFIGMGLHYFYNMTTTMDCATWPPVFLLYEGGQLIGLGIIPTGSFTKTDRQWFEDPGQFAVKAIVPRRPACLLDYARNFGSSSLHIFFKKNQLLLSVFSLFAVERAVFFLPRVIQNVQNIVK